MSEEKRMMRRSDHGLPQHRELPVIQPLPEDNGRPFWSVMIPTCNRTTHLEEALRSVLDQDPGPDQMQIEVVDNDSTKADPEKTVQEIGNGRIAFFRQQQQVGMAANWTTCIRRAIGQCVHILHDDDLVLPGFYARLREGLETVPSAGAAFCRHVSIDGDGHWQWLSPLENKSPGLLVDWLDELAIFQRIQCPAMVVRRATYEALGSFDPSLCYATDWEMWKRIVAHSAIWYEPQVLACYRGHSASATSALMKSCIDISDTQKAVQLSESYLPTGKARQLSQKAYEFLALTGIESGYRMLYAGEIDAAILRVRKSMRGCHSHRVLYEAAGFFAAAGAHWARKALRRRASFRLQS
jgi:GT2 family glycosyltransferase